MRYFLITFAVALSFTQVADAQLVCASRDEFVSHLEKKYGERPVLHGITNTNRVMELFASKNGDSWTIMLTGPNKTTCLISAGINLEFLPKKSKERGI